MIKHWPKPTGEEKAYSAYTSWSQSIPEGSEDRNSRQELKRKPWRNTAYWHAQLLSRTTCSETVQLKLGPSTSIIIKRKKKCPQPCPQTNLVGEFLDWGPLFPDDSNLYQGDKTKTELTSAWGRWSCRCKVPNSAKALKQKRDYLQSP